MVYMTYPVGSVSSGTMREEDLIPDFRDELERLSGQVGVSQELRKRARRLVREVGSRMETEGYFEGDVVLDDLEELFNVLGEFAGPYMYFGAHLGDGSDYGFWLIEDWDEIFDGLRVKDTSEVPSGYRGEVLCVNDHGNVTLYAATSRGLREIWGVV